MKVKSIQIFVAILLFLSLSCIGRSLTDNNNNPDLEDFSNAKYVPPSGKVLFVIGQNINCINNYINDIGPVPAGFMSYTSVNIANGLTTPYDTEGDPDARQYAQYIIDEPTWDNTVVQLGLWMNASGGSGVLSGITTGSYDTQLNLVATWIKNAARPVYLRIGYEFDGTHNAYEPAEYIAAYKYIVEYMETSGVDNVAFVWNSVTANTYNGYAMSSWYPGDDYVDWVGMSIFQQFQGTYGTTDNIDAVCDFADSHKKPIMICESTPYGGFPTRTWEDWFEHVFDYIESRNIKIFCYINTDWDLETQWEGQGWGDTRIEAADASIQSAWNAELSKNKYLHRDDNFISSLINY